MVHSVYTYAVIISNYKLDFPANSYILTFNINQMKDTKI